MKKRAPRWQAFKVSTCCFMHRFITLALENRSAEHLEVITGILKQTFLIRQALKALKVCILISVIHAVTFLKIQKQIIVSYWTKKQHKTLPIC